MTAITAALAQKLTDIRYEMLPPEAVDMARRLILDGIAVAVAGASWADGPRILAEHLQASAARRTVRPSVLVLKPIPCRQPI